jgi:hypothetical protein
MIPSLAFAAANVLGAAGLGFDHDRIVNFAGGLLRFLTCHLCPLSLRRRAI